jgi:transcriptional regulator with XRE-family HTH domain
MENVSLRRKINSKLALLGMNRKALAKELGVSRQYLSLVMHGHVKSEKVVKRLAAWADVTIDEVLEMTGGGHGATKEKDPQGKRTRVVGTADRVEGEVGG